jgi:arsenate reductase (thioredoxin)
MKSFVTAVILSVFSILGALVAQNGKTTGSPEVLFICEHGAAKSILAAAEFNKLAEQRGLPHRAVARGMNPDPTFSAATVSGLRKDGLPEPKGKPQMVTAADVTKAERVVTLGCKLPDSVGGSTKAADWSDVSSPSRDYDTARTDVVRHVNQLLDELARENIKK